MATGRTNAYCGGRWAPAVALLGALMHMSLVPSAAFFRPLPPVAWLGGHAIRGAPAAPAATKTLLHTLMQHGQQGEPSSRGPWHRRRVLQAASLGAAGGLLVPAAAAPSWAEGAPQLQDARRAPPPSRLSLLQADQFFNGEVPFAINELDLATAEALSQEDEFLNREDMAAADAIFTFRGGQLLKTNPDGALRYMSRRNAVFFGETHSSEIDKRLATRILRQLKRKRGKIALGLEMVQQPFQPVLNWYVFEATPSKDADRTLFRETEWDYRWGWDFEQYLPILKYAQLSKVPMLALNVEAELTARVRKVGLPALSPVDRERLILDPEGFRNDALSPGFVEYCDAVLRPSFDAHLQMGMFQNTPNAYSNFVSNRILWDETMASQASRFLLRNPDYLLCGLVGGDHVKTAHGIPARIERILGGIGGQTNARATSVALNPSWKLYSASRKLVDVDRRERLASGEVSRGGIRRGGGEDRRIDGDAGLNQVSEPGWERPPPRGQHPFSDIIWFS